jgi:hypothetical protein
MALQRKYITWESVVIDKYNHRHIKDTIDAKFSPALNYITDCVLREGTATGGYTYGYKGAFYVGMLEWDNSVVNIANHQDRLLVILGPFNIKLRTSAEVVGLLNAEYPAPQGESAYFYVHANGWTVVDRRPWPEDILP